MRKRVRWVRSGALVALVAGALVAAGCGGDGDDEGGDPAETTKSFLLALANQDGAAACELVAQAQLDEIETEGQSCADAVTEAASGATEDAAQDVEDATYEVTEETDSSATVTATRGDGESETFELTNEDGSWKLSG